MNLFILTYRTIICNNLENSHFLFVLFKIFYLNNSKYIFILISNLVTNIKILNHSIPGLQSKGGYRFMRILTSFLLIAILTLPIFFTINTTIAKKSDPLPCCNSMDPRYYSAQYWSWFCIQNGIEQEITISFQQCYCAWEINNWSPPIGMNCNILQQCGNK